MTPPVDPEQVPQVGLGRFGTPPWAWKALYRIAFWLWPPIVTMVAFVVLLRFNEGQVDRLALPNDDGKEIKGLQLKSLIRQVKAELQDADMEAINRHEAALFELKDFELDVNVVAKGAVGQNAEILTVGSNAEVSRERLQRIHLHWIANPQVRAVAVRRAKIAATPTDKINGDERP